MKMTTKYHKTHNYLFAKGTAVLKRYLPTVLLTLTTAATTLAQDRTITLQEAIKLGQDNSKMLKLSQVKVDEAISQYNQAKDRVLPTGNASFTYDRAEIPAHTLNFGPSTIGLPSGANAWLGIASVNEILYQGHKLKYAQESTELLTQVARLDIAKNRDEITYDIIKSYYDLYKVLQSKKVIDSNLKSIDEQIHQSQRFFDQGLVTKNDVLRFQLQRANVELNGIDLENNRRVINFNLDVMLGLPETTQLNIAQVNEATPPLAPLASYLDSAYANRQELAQLDLRSKVAETNIKDINANTAPTISGSVGGYYVNIGDSPLPKGGTYITPITIGATIAWKFDALWTNKNKLSQARIQKDEVTINKNIEIDNIKYDVNQSYQTYVTAVNKIKLLQTAIDQAGENNKILISKYRANTASATDRADAETLLFQAEINLELAKADAGLAYYTLLKSTGKLNKQ